MAKSFAERVVEVLVSLLPKPLDGIGNLMIEPLRGDLNSFLEQPRLKKELLEAAQRAESNFLSEAKGKLGTEKLTQAVAMLPIFDNELFQKALIDLPDHLNEDFVAQDLEKVIADGWKGEFKSDELRKGLAIYLNCLRIQLLKVDGYGDLVTRLAILRTDSRTEQISVVVTELRDLIKILSEKPSDIVSATKLLLDPFIAQENDIDRIQLFEPPKTLEKAREIIKARHILWITGPSGVGKRTCALMLGIELSLEKTYLIPRSISWRQVDEAQIAKSAIVFPDALGALRFERENIVDDVIYLRRILGRGNTLILTSPDDVFSDALQSTRIANLLLASQYELDRNVYSYKDKETIFQKMLDYADKNQHLINETQSNLAHELLSSKVGGAEKKNANKVQDTNVIQFRRLLKDNWLPIDIYRFVFVSLLTVQNPENLNEILRAEADIDKRVHAWFLNLIPSAQIFILTLTIFAGFDHEEVWRRYEAITIKLRDLDPLIAAIPLGILRQMTNPFITQEGLIDFINPRINHAIVHEIAVNYREYFLAILPLLTKWSSPFHISDETIDNSINRDRDIYTSIAYMVGEVGKYGIDDVRTIIDTWATNKYGRIARNAGIALRVIASDINQTQESLTIIKKMIFSRENKSENSSQRKWAAASALWRIGKLRIDYDFSSFVLQNLEWLAKDPDDYVVSSVAYAVNVLISTYKYEQLNPVIVRLSKSNDFRVKKTICSILDNLVSKNEKDVLVLLETYIDSESTNIFKTCVYYLLLGQYLGNPDRLNLTRKALERRPTFFAIALAELLAAPDEIYSMINTLENMAKENPDDFLPKFTEAITQLEIEEPNLNLLATLRNVAQSDNAFTKIVETVEEKYKLRKYTDYTNQFVDLVISNSEEMFDKIRQGLADIHIHDAIAEIIEEALISEDCYVKLKTAWMDFAISNPVEYQELQTEILTTRKPEKKYPKANSFFTEINLGLQIAIRDRIETMIVGKPVDFFNYFYDSCRKASQFNLVLTACEALITEEKYRDALKEILIDLSRQNFVAYSEAHSSFYSAANQDSISDHVKMNEMFIEVDQELEKYFERYVSQEANGLIMVIRQLENPILRKYIINALKILVSDDIKREQAVSKLVSEALTVSIGQRYWLLLESNASEIATVLSPLYANRLREARVSKNLNYILGRASQTMESVRKFESDLDINLLTLEKASEDQTNQLIHNLAHYLLENSDDRQVFESFASNHADKKIIQNLSSAVRSNLFGLCRQEYDDLEELIGKDKHELLKKLDSGLEYYSSSRDQYKYAFELLIRQDVFNKAMRQFLVSEFVKHKFLNGKIFNLVRVNSVFNKFILDVFRDVIADAENKLGLPYYPLLEFESNVFTNILIELAFSQQKDDENLVFRVLTSLANWQVLQNSNRLFEMLRGRLGDAHDQSITRFNDILKNITFYYPEIGSISLYSKVYENMH